MPNPPLVFQSEASANALVAGIPAAARALRDLANSESIDLAEPLIIAFPNATTPLALLKREIDRLLPDLDWRLSELSELTQRSDGMVIDGLGILNDPRHIRPLPLGQIVASHSTGIEDQEIAVLKSAGRRIIAQTSKPTDGIVSRYLNRPVSQSISRILLRFPAIRPIHATIATAAIGVLMAICLFAGGVPGMYWGAILFQLASIADGVDGEIARATFRTSRLGATLDTASDAATNFAFMAGLCINLWQQGAVLTAQTGLGALTLLIIGLAMLGSQSLRAGGPLSFDGLKTDQRTAASPIMRRLSQIASRDVYALVFAVMVLVGLAAEAVILFSIAVTIWFVTVIAMLMTSRTETRL